MLFSTRTTSSLVGTTCPHCGAHHAVRLGECGVCKTTVCDHCGNVQYIRGERQIVHDACLEQASGSFSMIKFVK